MAFLGRYWSEIQSAWGRQPQGKPRGRICTPQVEPLEVRTLLAGEFTEASGIFTPTTDSSVAWGDMDNDGKLDLVTSGYVSGSPNRATIIYKNLGNNGFQPLSAGIAGARSGSVAWGDSDNDGDLDLLVTGYDSGSGRLAKVYRNNGDSTFTDTMASLTAVSTSAAAWGDSDNDGDLDILLTGYTGSAATTKLYRNDGNYVFVEVNEGMSNVRNGAVAWADSDNDGDLDVLVTGSGVTANSHSTKLYRNDGNNSFTEVAAGLAAVDRGGIAWGDYDNDGKLDILLTGLAGSSIDTVTKVYRNLGNNAFSDIAASLTPLSQGGAAWGDFDNDGDLDILQSGLTAASQQMTQVYRNNGSGVFVGLTNPGLTGMHTGSAAWADTDGDRDLDFVVTGISPGSNFAANLYVNNAATANTAPNAPSNLTATGVTSTSVRFNWSAPTDNQTPTDGLSYNLRVGTAPGTSDVFSTMANTFNGNRLLAKAGPIQGTSYSASYTLKNLTVGTTYYWSVQAIDSAFGDSPWAAEQPHVVTHVNTTPTLSGLPANQSVADNTTISPFSSLTVNDPDTQNLFSRVTIFNGVARGDFTSASAAGWTRTTVGNDIKYERFFNAQPNNGGVVQAAIRPFVFEPRKNAIKPNTTEQTLIRAFVNDGGGNFASDTRITTTSVNNPPTIGSPSNTVAVNDNATVNPFPTLTVTDADMQEMLISVTILNGKVRGDFTTASVVDWPVRYLTGNNITYKRYFGPQANVGAAAQAAFRALVFQPRTNAIKPGTTELTDFQVTVSDGVALAIADTGTRVTTTSVNNAPTIGGAVANQTMNDNQTKAVFSSLTVTDPDTQDQFARVTITGGTTKGDFTAASTIGWTRKTSGGNILYERFFAAATNNAAIVQAAVRALVFQPRNNVPIGTTETTSFTVFVNDGLANVTNSQTSVSTTGVAPRSAPSVPAIPPLILDGDITTAVLPGVRKNTISPLARLLKKPR